MTNLVSCPLCLDDRLIRVPPDYDPLWFYYGKKGGNAIHDKEIHVVRGPDCWQGQGGSQSGYRGTNNRYGQSQRTRIIPEVFRPDWQPLSPKPSQALINHSPDGFQWGYAGSGPAQLALAILLDHTKDEEFSLNNYQLFKEAFVVHFGDTWAITTQTLNLFYHQAHLVREHIQEQQDGALEQARERMLDKLEQARERMLDKVLP